MQTTPAPRAATGLQRFRAVYGLVLEWVVMALVVALAVEVTVGVVFRAFGSSLVWYDELASHMLAWLTFYGSALASVRRAHIGCPEVVERLPRAARRVLAVFAQLVVIAFFAVLGWMGVSIMQALMGETLVSLSWVPMNFVQSALPIASAMVVIAEVAWLVELFGAPLPEPTAPGTALADGLH